MAERKLGSATTAVLLVILVLLGVVAWRESREGGPLDGLDVGLSGTTASTTVPVAASAAPVVATAAPAATGVPVVLPSAYQLRGVVVDHDVVGLGGPSPRWILQVFVRDLDEITYLDVSETVWRSCPVPGEFVVDRCVAVTSYDAELPVATP